MKKKGWPRKATLVEVPIYGVPVWFITDRDTFLACHEWLTKKPAPALNVAGRCSSYEHEDGDFLILVAVFNGTTSTLVHELSHAVDFLLANVGVDDAEARAYLAAWLWRATSPLLKRADRG